jgi:DMSO/TMAO reductase YedYZ molybdopterin-dependent catalytic subunit
MRSTIGRKEITEMNQPNPERSRGVATRVVFAVVCLLLATRTLAAGLVTEEVRLTGAVKTPLVLKAAELRTFPADQITSVTLTRQREGRTVETTVRGVRLTTLLDRAELVAKSGNDWRHAIVLAESSDGYRVAFSWPELFNTEVGAGVLVVFERDGQALADSEGRIALVSARDLRSGPRSVKWLSRIDVRVLKD